MSDETDLNPQTPQTEAPQEPIPAPEQAVPVGTAQIPNDEPLSPEPEPIAKQSEEPEIPEVEVTEPKPETQTSTPSPTEASLPSVPIIIEKPQSRIKELLNNARFAIQIRKRKKLEKILSSFAKRTSITNDEVEKLLHVSDATATRYLTILKKEGKIQQNGKTGKGVSYSKL